MEYEPLVNDLKQLIQKKQYHALQLIKKGRNGKTFWCKLITHTYKQGYYPAAKISEPPVFNSVDDLSTYVTNH